MRSLTVTLLRLVGLALAVEAHGVMQVVVALDGEAPRLAQPGAPQLLHGEGQVRMAPRTLGVAGLPQVGRALTHRPMDGLFRHPTCSCNTYTHVRTKYKEIY